MQLQNLQPVKVVLGQHHAAVVGQARGQQRIRVLGDEVHGEGVEERDALYSVQGRVHAGAGVVSNSAFKGEFHILGREWSTIVEDNALAQLELPGGGIDELP